MANMSFKIFEQKSRHLITGLQKANALSKLMLMVLDSLTIGELKIQFSEPVPKKLKVVKSNK